jgi:hypothetical protein
MKKLIFLFVLSAILVAMNATAQPTTKINYQAVARDVSGAIMSNQSISIRLTIEDGFGGTPLYVETQGATTNQFGLFRLKIGSGFVVSGVYSSIDWSTGNQWLKVEMDPTGGNSYVDMGETQLLAVPFANYAASSGTAYTSGTGIDITSGVVSLTNTTVAAGSYGDNSTVPMITIDAQGRITDAVNAPINGLLPPGNAGLTLRHNGSNWIANGNLYNDGTNVGIGTTNPSSLLHLNNYAGTVVLTMTQNFDAKIEAANDVSNGTSLRFYTTDNVVTSEKLRIDNAGNVGIGITVPVQKLEVTGAIKIGDTGSNTAGSIRYHNSGFEGYDGIAWQSFGNHAYQSILNYSLVSSARNTTVLTPDSIVVGETGYYLASFNFSGKNASSYIVPAVDYDQGSSVALYKVGTGAISQSIPFFSWQTGYTSSNTYYYYADMNGSNTMFYYFTAGTVLKLSAYVQSAGAPSGPWQITSYNLAIMKIAN